MNDVTIQALDDKGRPTGKAIHTDIATMKKATRALKKGRTKTKPKAKGKAAAKEPRPAENMGGVSGGQLKSIVERIERMEEERAAVAADIRDIYAEAKANGFDVKVLREVIKRRKSDQQELFEFNSLLDTYMHALGMA